jgi:hypothetical protein
MRIFSRKGPTRKEPWQMVFKDDEARDLAESLRTRRSPPPSAAAPPSPSPAPPSIIIRRVRQFTTTDGRSFDRLEEALAHEAHIQIFKALEGKVDTDVQMNFAAQLARNYALLLPVLQNLAAEADALHEKMREERIE